MPIYEAPDYFNDNIFHLLISMIALIMLVLRYKTGALKEKIGYTFFFTISMIAFIDNYSINSSIQSALKGKCLPSDCEVIIGEVKNFKSYPGRKKYITNEFLISGRKFIIEPRNIRYGYNKLYEQGGVFREGNSIFKVLLYKD